jgi:hypothetical protein
VVVEEVQMMVVAVVEREDIENPLVLHLVVTQLPL